MYVKYTSNNSGGSWWLTDQNWKDLESAGWEVDWIKHGDGWADASGRWLGALARSATRRDLSLEDAIEEFERVTGESANAAGCSCCGQPHIFYSYTDNGSMIDSGPMAVYDDYDDYDDEYFLDKWMMENNN